MQGFASYCATSVERDKHRVASWRYQYIQLCGGALRYVDFSGLEKIIFFGYKQTTFWMGGNRISLLQESCTYIATV